MLQLEVQNTQIKLSKFLLSNIPSLSFGLFKSLLKKGDIKVNGTRVKTDVNLSNCDKIIIYYNEQEFTPKVMFEDENIIVFDKPKKIKCQGQNSFEEKINKYYESDWILAHRLDTNTSGLLLFAKSKSVYEELKIAFKERKIKKYYMAKVYGKVQKEELYKDFLFKDEKNGKVIISKNKKIGCQDVITKVIPIRYGKDYTICKIELITGRTHQIRAHLAFYGHFVIGDSKYGIGAINKTFGESRQLLDGFMIEFADIKGFLSYLNGVVIKKETAIE